MTKDPSVNEVRSFEYIIVNGSGPSMNSPVARLIVVETKSGNSRSALPEIAPAYGFRLIDGDGVLLAEIAPGYWPFVKKAIEETAAFHSPACDEDCREEIGPVSPMKRD